MQKNLRKLRKQNKKLKEEDKAALMRLKLENDNPETRYNESDMKHNDFMANYSAVIVDKLLYDEAVMKKGSTEFNKKLQN